MALPRARDPHARPPREVRSTHPEGQLQGSLVEFFRLAVAPGDALLFACPNGELRSYATAALLSGIPAAARDAMPDELAVMPYGQGVVPGAPDLILLLRGRMVAIECKRPRRPGSPAGALSASQRRFHHAAALLGHPVRLVSSLVEFAALLRAEGLVLRARL